MSIHKMLALHPSGREVRDAGWVLVMHCKYSPSSDNGV